MNSSPDELIFITFSGLKLEATILSTFQKLSLNVANVQVSLYVYVHIWYM